jgi:hypothetical protein
LKQEQEYSSLGDALRMAAVLFVLYLMSFETVGGAWITLVRLHLISMAALAIEL